MVGVISSETALSVDTGEAVCIGYSIGGSAVCIIQYEN